MIYFIRRASDGAIKIGTTVRPKTVLFRLAMIDWAKKMKLPVPPEI